MPFSSSSYTSFSISTSASATRNGETQTWGYRSAREVYRDEDNTRHERSLSQRLGEEPVYEERHYDAQGRQVIDDGRQQRDGQGQRQGRIEDVSEREQ
ncbi:hypothetical protein TMatcc_006368 [Talaromyces marneffei ATCC 18224]|uniref:Uncharacterized protein n=1 Tax=Talaromyces marneffei (strain ATCC 18224 / CBS 334.59 / QM 7333) TaxID=441960 RepID=B6QBD3_TALMQ|nr:uncharacterized protein EYB26_002687 [Talaromyces marneffei]EEA25409.1 hypothetical protein PMAA_065190 [Talaromyces marneffei ATCC 18224]KAE8554135.1 hypothetical protein EYB25_002673 [Talaromyces marneffei]QGA15031.1 hypothetical protein EYB26_002687 [Talaromyces marneffei]